MPELGRDDAWVRGLGIGVAAGSRTTLGLLGPVAAGAGQPRHPAVRLLATAGIAGEIVGDKLPWTPSRVAGAGPFFRVVAGAVGALQLGAGGSPGRRLAVAGVGAAGALAGTWAGYGWRRLFARRGLPDWPAAVTEDVVALVLAAASLGVRVRRDPAA